MTKKVTIKEVASWAGVSTATVSHHLNGTKNVSPDVARRIDSAVQELNYIPNINARSLKRNETHMIGLVIPDMIIYSSICYHIEALLYERGYNVIICNTNFDHIRENIYLHSLLERRVDGLIVASTGNNSRLLDSIQASGIPVVLIDRILPDLKANYVTEKHRECITKLTNHLLENNHRNIAFVKGPASSYVSDYRFGIFCDILKERGIPLLPQFYFSNCGSEELCRQAFDQIFAHLDTVTAVMLTNSNQIKYLIKAAHKNGISLPEDLSFLGFGLEDYKSLFHYPITCIIQNHYELARNAADRILELIAAQESNAVPELRTVLVDSEFFIGSSVRKLPDGTSGA